MKFEPISEEIERLAKLSFESALKVHKTLGAGLLESIYEVCLAHELTKLGLKVERQVKLPIVYDGIKFDEGFRIDLWVERNLILEIKSVESILNVHQAQVMTYLKLTENRLGLILNFNSALLKNGVKRIIL